MIEAVPLEAWYNKSNEVDANSLFRGNTGSEGGSSSDGNGRENNSNMINDESHGSMTGIRSPC
jgi:hypothetical protein